MRLMVHIHSDDSDRALTLRGELPWTPRSMPLLAHAEGCRASAMQITHQRAANGASGAP